MTKLGIYVHFSGKPYRVLGTMKNTTNGPADGQTLVQYIALYGEGKMFAREEKQFHEQVFVNMATGVAQTTDPGFPARDTYRVCRRFTFEKE